MKATILYHGKLKGVITSGAEIKNAKVTEHPFFNMSKSAKSVEQEMDRLRGGRFRAI